MNVGQESIPVIMISVYTSQIFTTCSSKAILFVSFWNKFLGNKSIIAGLKMIVFIIAGSSVPAYHQFRSFRETPPVYDVKYIFDTSELLPLRHLSMI
jgi:hypothetical protein